MCSNSTVTINVDLIDNRENGFLPCLVLMILGTGSIGISATVTKLVI